MKNSGSCRVSFTIESKRLVDVFSACVRQLSATITNTGDIQVIKKKVCFHSVSESAVGSVFSGLW